MRRKVMVVFGTRPETIKLAPVVRALAASDSLRPFVCVTGQHREMLDQMLGYFDLRPDRDLEVMQPNQSLAGLTARLLTGLREVIAAERPDALLVQGDTTTTFTAALAGFYERVPAGHVEAGLRTGDPFNPFPEEVNRRLTTQVAAWHYAPTHTARDNLLRDGVAAGRIEVTGNTIVDAMEQIVEHLDRHPGAADAGELEEHVGDRRLVLVTGHRRESFGAGLRGVCAALRAIADRFDDVCVLYPVHLNPNVRGPVKELLGRHPRIVLTEPLGYLPFVHLMRKACILITDSGGIQEEAPSLGVPALVTRSTTERPEGIEAGVAQLVGTDAETITRAASRLLDEEAAREAMTTAANPYGDGRAAGRIVTHLEHVLGETTRQSRGVASGG